MVEATSAARPGSAGVAPAVTGAALAGFLSREKSFLQNLARMMQDHANAMKEDVRRVRDSAAGGRSGGPSGGQPAAAAPASPPEAPRPRQPESEHELWRPPPEGGGDQPPYFPDDRARLSDPGPRSGERPAGRIEPSGHAQDERDLGQRVIDLMDGEERPQMMEAEARSVRAEDPVVEAGALPPFEPEARKPFDPGVRPGFEGDAPPAASPYVDEPTSEWTLGEGGVDAGDAGELVVRREGAPGARAARWTPRPEDEAPGDERSLKELFWGED
jgi:hypothetical protein